MTFEFVPVFGSGHDLSAVKGTTLVIPVFSAGMSAMVACDLFIMNEQPTKLGYIRSEFISPLVQMVRSTRLVLRPRCKCPLRFT